MYSSLIKAFSEKYDKCTNKEIFEAFINSSSGKLKEIFLLSDKCPKTLIEKHYSDFDNGIISPSLSEDFLREYYENHKTDTVNILRNPNCPKDLIQTILEGTLNINAYRYIASHKNTSSSSLKELWQRCHDEKDPSNYGEYDEYDEIRELIVSNPNCPKEIISYVASHGYDTWKVSLLKSDNCTEKLFNTIFSHRFRFTTDKDPEGKNNAPFGVVLALSSSEFCTKDKLQKLLKDCKNKHYHFGDRIARELLATNPHALHRDTLIELTRNSFMNANFYDKGMINILASNPRTPKEALEIIVDFDVTKQNFYDKEFDEQDLKESEFIKRVLTHPNCDKELFDKIVSKTMTRGNHHYNEIRKMLLNSKYITLEDFVKLTGVDLSEELIDLNNHQNTVKENKKFRELREKDSEYDESRDEAINKIISSIRSVAESAKNFESIYGTSKRAYNNIRVSENLIFIEVGDHYEIRPECIDLLKYMNLSLIDTTNLKVSGIDFRGTNIRINPQTVYNKDLSNSYFDEANIFGSFDGCNLSGADISREDFLIGIDNATISETTSLPKR